MPAGGVAQAVCRISCKGFARFSLEIPLSLETKCEPKTIPKSLQNRRKWRQNGSGDPSGEGRERPGTARERCRKKGDKQVRKRVGASHTNRVPKSSFFFIFRIFWKMKKSYENAIVANERFSTRFGHRTHSGTLRASVLTSFWAPKWYFFERKNVPRKNYDFHRFFDDIKKKQKKRKKNEKCLK